MNFSSFWMANDSLMSSLGHGIVDYVKCITQKEKLVVK